MPEITIRSLKNERHILHDVIPIDTPYMFGIYLGDICNFRCKYCIQSATDDVKEKQQLIKKFLTWDTFKKIADATLEFPNKIQTILFTSMGEPLLNPELPRMLHYLNQLQAAEAYEIVSNASLLTPELGEALIDAGLTRFCISIQGLTGEKYKEVCGVELDMQKFLQNIKSFYDYSRGKCKLHIKILDLALEAGEEDEFYQMFGSMCDTIHIDKVLPVFSGMDYEDMIIDKEGFSERSFQQKANMSCNTIFYTLYTLADGSIAPCCIHPQPLIYGNINDMSLVDAWNSKLRETFIKQHLKHQRKENKVCRNCVVPLDIKFQEDSIEGYEEEIFERMYDGIKGE